MEEIIMIQEYVNNKEWLYNKYVVENLSIQEISSIAETRQATISSKLKEYGISRKEALYKNKEWLYDQYITNHKSAVEIAKLIDSNPTTIKRWIKRFNLVNDPKPYTNKNWLIDQLKNKEGSVSAISEETGFEKATLHQWIRKFNIDVDKHYYRKYDFNEKYFDEINTEYKAYFLGFIMADGNVNKELGQLTINIQEQDGYILEELKKDLNTNAEIKYSKPEEDKGCKYRQGQASLSISSAYMCKKLLLHGIGPKKSGKEILPDTIPQEFVPHFIRGFLDGDGHIDKDSKKVELCSSSINILYSIKLFAEMIIGVDEYKIVKYIKSYNNNMFYYKLYGDNAIKFLDIIYKDATIFLIRKHDTYLTYSPAIWKRIVENRSKSGKLSA